MYDEYSGTLYPTPALLFAIELSYCMCKNKHASKSIREV